MRLTRLLGPTMVTGYAGGLFLGADSADALRDALFKTVEEVKTFPPPMVEAPGTTTLKGPASVSAGSDFTVEWQVPGSYATYSYTRGGNPVKIKTPKTPGTYEVCYILGRGEKMLDKATITIK